MIFAGSWVAVGIRHRASPADKPWSRPERRKTSTSNTPPAWPTADVLLVSTRTLGYNPILFT
jgi:hypothetical protein